MLFTNRLLKTIRNSARENSIGFLLTPCLSLRYEPHVFIRKKTPPVHNYNDWFRGKKFYVFNNNRRIELSRGRGTAISFIRNYLIYKIFLKSSFEPHSRKSTPFVPYRFFLSHPSPPSHSSYINTYFLCTSVNLVRCRELSNYRETGPRMFCNTRGFIGLVRLAAHIRSASQRSPPTPAASSPNTVQSPSHSTNVCIFEPSPT